MTTTSNYGITLLEQSQAQKEVTINEALSVIDAMLKGAVLDKDVSVPPLSPMAGDAYIVAASPTGAWTGKAGFIAYYDQIWRFIVPTNAMRIWVNDEQTHYVYSGTSWQIFDLGGLSAGEVLTFSPLQGNGCKAWISASNYQSISSISGAALTTIRDTSGFANHATQAAGLKPNWGTTLFNGVAPGIENTTTNMNVIDASSIQNIFAGGGTIAMSFILRASGANQTLFYKSTNGGGLSTSGYTCLFYGSGGGVTLRFMASGATASGVWDTAVLVPLNVPIVMTITYNTSTPTVAPVITINGITQTMLLAQAQSGAAGSDAGANFIIGNNQDGGLQPFMGTWSQFALFNGTQSADFITRLRSYFAALSSMRTAHVYVLCGQSNMVGNASSTNVSSMVPEISENGGFIWDGNSWAPLVAGNTNQALDSNSIGPEISFATIAGIKQGAPAYLVKYAVGSTSLAVEWAPSSGAQWLGMRAAIDAAALNIANSGMLPVFCAFLWTQGETDAQSLTYANAYQTNLTNFIAQVNTQALGRYAIAPNYRFLISGLPTQNLTTLPHQAIVRAAQTVVGGSVGNGYISATDVSLNGDGVHLDGPGQLALGERFARQVDYRFAAMNAALSSGIAQQASQVVQSTILAGFAVALTTNVAANVTSVSLPPGDWDVWGSVSFNPAGTTTVSGLVSSISTTSATHPAVPGNGAFSQLTATLTTGGAQTLTAGKLRLTLTAPTIVFLVASATFGVSTMGAFGYIAARRRR